MDRLEELVANDPAGQERVRKADAAHRREAEGDRLRQAPADRPGGPPGAYKAEIERLASLPGPERDAGIKAAAKRFGCYTSTVKADVTKHLKASVPATAEPAAEGTSRALDWSEPEPWPEPVDGAELFDELAATFRRFLVLQPGCDTTLALWVLHAHAFEASFITPRLAIASPEMRCGKSTVLKIVRALAPRPLLASNVTAAALFRTIELVRPTLLVDEADTFLPDNEELRGVLNSGHDRTGEVIRVVGDDHEPRRFSTWAPVAMAAIGKLPGTLADRSVAIPMQRKAAGERVER
jgi:putative DNA primase/helicase